MTRTIVYVDGFNLYYGTLQNSSEKWLDLEAYFRQLLKHDDIKRISYFTAKVKNTSSTDQKVYLDALGTTPLVVVKYGLFKTKQIKCRVKACTHAADRNFSAFEEKGTDVNIAIQMLDDAYQNRCDRIVLVTADSDLVPPLHLIRNGFPKLKIDVFLPYRHLYIYKKGKKMLNPRSQATELKNIADNCVQLPLRFLSRAQFPISVPDGQGGFIVKPSNW